MTMLCVVILVFIALSIDVHLNDYISIFQTLTVKYGIFLHFPKIKSKSYSMSSTHPISLMVCLNKAIAVDNTVIGFCATVFWANLSIMASVAAALISCFVFLLTLTFFSFLALALIREI